MPDWLVTILASRGCPSAGTILLFTLLAQMVWSKYPPGKHEVHSDYEGDHQVLHISASPSALTLLVAVPQREPCELCRQVLATFWRCRLHCSDDIWNHLDFQIFELLLKCILPTTDNCTLHLFLLFINKILHLFGTSLFLWLTAALSVEFIDSHDFVVNSPGGSPSPASTRIFLSMLPSMRLLLYWTNRRWKPLWHPAHSSSTASHLVLHASSFSWNSSALVQSTILLKYKY